MIYVPFGEAALVSMFANTTNVDIKNRFKDVDSALEIQQKVLVQILEKFKSLEKDVLKVNPKLKNEYILCNTGLTNASKGLELQTNAEQKYAIVLALNHGDPEKYFRDNLRPTAVNALNINNFLKVTPILKKRAQSNPAVWQTAEQSRTALVASPSADQALKMANIIKNNIDLNTFKAITEHQFGSSASNTLTYKDVLVTGPVSAPGRLAIENGSDLSTTKEKKKIPSRSRRDRNLK